MSKLQTALYLLRNNKKVFWAQILKTCPNLFPDRFYIQAMYYLKMGRKLNLDDPHSFTEKLQWLKLFDRDSNYCKMVDKYLVKEHVAGLIGKEYIIPTLGVWDSVDSIDFNSLPDRFVLKTTHGGGSNGVVICKDKKSLDIQVVKNRLKQSMKQKIYEYNREWPYKNVKPRIIAEHFMEETGLSNELADYKFFCFNGEPKYCQVIRDRHTKETIDFYDMDWNHQDFVGLNPVARNGLTPVARPCCLNDMINICRKLSERIPFARIDLYVISSRPFFGEITFYPNGGFGAFTPNNWDEIMGNLLIIR